jgi:hypothetical protein
MQAASMLADGAANATGKLRQTPYFTKYRKVKLQKITHI